MSLKQWELKPETEQNLAVIFLIDEIWLLIEDRCVLYRSYTKTPIELHSQLFSAFISALMHLSEVVGTSAIIKNVELLNARLTIVRKTLNDGQFTLVGRSSLNDPLERVYQQIQALATELQYVLDGLSSDAVKIGSMNVKGFENILESEIGPQLTQWAEMNAKLTLVDQITLVGLISELLDHIINHFALSTTIEGIVRFDTDPGFRNFAERVIDKDHEVFKDEIDRQRWDLSTSLLWSRKLVILALEHIKEPKTRREDITKTKLDILDYLARTWPLFRYFQLEDLLFDKYLSKLSR